MTYKLEIYNNQKPYIYPDMSVATPESVANTFAVVNFFTCVVTTDLSGEMFFSIDPINVMRAKYEIDSTLSEADALAAIEAIINTAPATQMISAEERLAASVEFMAMMAM